MNPFEVRVDLSYLSSLCYSQVSEQLPELDLQVS